MRAMYGMKVLDHRQMLGVYSPPAPPTWREVATGAAFTALHIVARIALTLVLCAASVAALTVAGIPQLAPIAGVLIGFMVWQ